MNGYAAAIPAASGRYSGCPASGLSHTRRWQLRWRRSIPVADGGGIAPVPAVRHDDDDAARAQRPPRPAQVECARRIPDRVPPDQSLTASEARASARSGSRARSSRVTRVRCVPKTNASAWTPGDR